MRWQIRQRVTGSWVTVTGKRPEGDLLICLDDARAAGVILQGTHAARTPCGMSEHSPSDSQESTDAYPSLPICDIVVACIWAGRPKARRWGG
jgi:hypothetical protein